MLVLYLFLISILILPLPITVSFLSNHTFVFITGWPQSGTSFIHQLISQEHDLFASMITQCEQLLGIKRCQSWNHEGQWMIDGKLRALIDAGNICPVTEIEESEKREEIINSWSRFWSLDKPYLIEKSPQNFVKISMLQQLFRDAKGIKIIVILKHPVTLNIATMKDTSWKYREIVDKKSKEVQNIELKNEEIQENFHHFVKLMTHQVNASEHQDCSLGWLPAMNYLYDFLQSHRSFSQENIRILRFERLVKPLAVCSNLFKFLLGKDFSQIQSKIVKMCNRLFPATLIGNSGASSNSLVPKYPTQMTISSSLGISSTSQKAGKKHTNSRKRRGYHSNRHLIVEFTNHSIYDTEEGTIHRHLRLRTSKESPSFVFRPELVKANGVKRLQEFQSVFRHQYLSKALFEQLLGIQQELLGFGYQYSDFTPTPSKLDAWEIK